MNLKKKKKNCDPTDGNVLWSGSQQLRATTPASLYWAVKAVYKDSAPPWWRERNKKNGWLDCAPADKGAVDDVKNREKHLREATEDDARRRNPVFGLVVNDGFDWMEW